MDPLQTRSMPGALWEKVPAEFQAWDENLRASIFDYSLRWTPFWKVFKFFSENSWGITLTLLIFLIAASLIKYSLDKDFRSQKFVWVKQRVSAIGFLALAIGFSDIFSNLLKLWVGRLKPHVNFYNPTIVPALSFPSNHAFNSLLAVLLVGTCWIFQKQEWSKKEKVIYWLITIPSVIFIGFSRVAMGQHYVSDILAGWLIAIVTWYLLKDLYKKVLWRFIK